MSLELGGRNPDRSFLIMSLKSPRFMARLSTSNFLSGRPPVEKRVKAAKLVTTSVVFHDSRFTDEENFFKIRSVVYICLVKIPFVLPLSKARSSY